MDAIWAPVVAALGSSSLTTVGILLRDRIQGQRDRRASLQAACKQAYGQMLTGCAIFMLEVGGVHLAMEVRSGLKEGVDIALRQRKPIDPLELVDRLIAHSQPLFDAWSTIWSVGTPEAIAAANVVMNWSTKALTMHTRPGAARSPLATYVLGQKWTDEQMQQAQEAMVGLGNARKRLAEIARKEFGMEKTDLFAGQSDEVGTQPTAMPRNGMSSTGADTVARRR